MLFIFMKKLKPIIFLLVLLSVPFLNAQNQATVEQVTTYLNSNGTMKQYQDAYRELLKLMERQFPKSDKNGNGWLYLEKNEKKALMEIRDLLVPVYITHFSGDDLNKMQDFYSTAAGKQWATDKTGLSAVQGKEVDAFYNSAIGLKIREQQATMTSEIEAVSEYWSKDLYQTAVLLLKEE